MVDKRFIISVGEHFIVCEGLERVNDKVMARTATGEILAIDVDEISNIYKETIQKEELSLASL